MNKIRIAYIITGLEVGGAEAMLYKLIVNLPEEFDVLVISLGSEGYYGTMYRDLDIPVYSIGMLSYKNFFACFKHIYDILREFKPDMIHTWMYHADLIGGIIGNMLHTPVVWSIRHSSLSLKHNKLRTILVIFINSLLSWFVPKKILFNSLEAKKIHARIGYCFLKSIFIPNGFNLSYGHSLDLLHVRQKLRSRLGLLPTSRIVGHVGRYDPLKNYPGLLEAFSLIQQRFKDVQFVLVGRNVNDQNLELNRLIKFFRLTNIHLLDQQSSALSLIAGFDVLVLSSHSEAFPNVLGEALSVGVPCVSTNVGDAHYIIGNAGFTVPVGEMSEIAEKTICILQSSVQEREEFVFNAKLRMQEFDIKIVSKRYEELYKTVHY